MTKFSDVIHPLGYAVPAEPAGASRMKWSLKCTRGNTKRGGIACPTALTTHHTVTSWPRSQLVSAPTITFGGFCTVVHPVSSTFQMSFASNLYRSRTEFRLLQNNMTFFSLKLEARAIVQIYHSCVCSKNLSTSLRQSSLSSLASWLAKTGWEVFWTKS